MMCPSKFLIKEQTFFLAFEKISERRVQFLKKVRCCLRWGRETRKFGIKRVDWGIVNLLTMIGAKTTNRDAARIFRRAATLCHTRRVLTTLSCRHPFCASTTIQNWKLVLLCILILRIRASLTPCMFVRVQSCRFVSANQKNQHGFDIGYLTLINSFETNLSCKKY